MDTVHVLALTAGTLTAIAFWMYNKDVFFGGTRPNAATWFLWSLVTVVNATSYYSMSVHWTTMVVMSSDALLCTATFFFLLWKGKFGNLNKSNWVVIILSVGVIILWKTTSAKEGNIMAQIPMILSFLPILRDAKHGTTVENPWIWILWTTAFTINLLLVFMTWSHIIDFVYPIIAVILHITMVYYAFRGKRIYSVRKHIIEKAKPQG